MKERKIDLVLRQNGQEVPKGGQDGHSRTPACEVPRAKQRRLPKDFERGPASRKLTLYRLCNGESKIVRHADFEPLPPIRVGFRVPEFGPDPHLPAAQFDWAGRHVIRPEIKGAAARKIEPGMVPVTGENAVLDASAIEGEPHVRASVVKGVNATPIIDDEDGPLRPTHDEPPFGVEFGKRACTLELGAHDPASSRRTTLGTIAEFSHATNQDGDRPHLPSGRGMRIRLLNVVVGFWSLR
jgi:hypothetical protein